jgi:phosphonate transport system permease protein
MNSEATETLGLNMAHDMTGRHRPAPRLSRFWKIAIIVIVALIIAQAAFVVKARPQDLITGVGGMADILSRSFPPDLTHTAEQLWPALETVDIAIFGTSGAVVLALPLAVLAARNTSPAKPAYYVARSFIAICRSVPDLVWALLFVTAVGLGPFAGALALTVHSIGMLGRLLAEVIEDMDMGPMEALATTGAGRLQVFTHAVIPTVLPSLLGIALYRFDENIRSSLVLGFVGAGGIGFQLLSAMNLFDYQTVSLLLIMTFVIVISAERMSAALRKLVA